MKAPYIRHCSAVYSIAMWNHAGHEVESWQWRAAEARAMAVNLTSEESRWLMLRVAETYDEMARRAECKGTP